MTLQYENEEDQKINMITEEEGTKNEKDKVKKKTKSLHQTGEKGKRE